MIGQADVRVKDIDDAQRQTVLHGQRQELRVQMIAARQPERDVTYTEHAAAAQFVPDAADRLQGDKAVAAARGDGQRQRVEDNIFFVDAVRGGCVVDLLCDGDAPVRRIGDAVFIEQQADDDAAVFFHEREQFFHLFLLACDRIEQGFAIIDPHAAFHGNCIAGVQAQGQRRGGLEFGNKASQDGGLVDIGHADVDIEDRCIGILLPEPFCEQGVQFSFLKGGAHLLPDAGIDAFADQERLFADHNGAGEGGHDGPLFAQRRLERDLFADLDGLANVLRAGAAAAAGACDAEGGELFHIACELVRIDVVTGHAVLAARQARIRIGDDGE